MFPIRGANALIALRCNRLSGKFEDYWSTRQEPARSSPALSHRAFHEAGFLDHGVLPWYF
jgi:hypothetical protein